MYPSYLSLPSPNTHPSNRTHSDRSWLHLSKQKTLHESVYYLFLTFLPEVSIMISKGKIETCKVARTSFPLFHSLTLKGQSKAIQSHGSTFVELDYTVNGLYNHISPLAVTMATYVKDYLDLTFWLPALITRKLSRRPLIFLDDKFWHSRKRKIHSDFKKILRSGFFAKVENRTFLEISFRRIFSFFLWRFQSTLQNIKGIKIGGHRTSVLVKYFEISQIPTARVFSCL